jgi:O-antigen/teichoic acid export membrane protein
MLRQLALHSSKYSIGTLLVTLASLFSFPIVTRIFTVDEYGLLNLISATLLLLTGIAKMGVQHSIMRFYGEARAAQDRHDLTKYYSTTLFGMMAVALIVTILWAFVSQLIPSNWWQDRRVTGLLLLTAVLVVVRSVDSCLSNFLRAEQQSGRLSIYSVAKKYVGLGAILFTVFFVARDLYGFYSATVVSELGAVLVLGALLYKERCYSAQAFSPSLFRRMLMFSIPMIGYELSGILLSTGDRYVIQKMLGSTPLGIYSTGYNLCEYVQIVVLASIGQAIVPMYIQSWEENGEEETGRLIRKALHFYLMLGLPIIAGLSVVGEELLVFLASEKYRQSATIIPYIISGMVLDGLVIIVGAGLYINKRTMIIAALVGVSACLNVVLNIVFIPYLGLIGAALATLFSYGALAFGVLWAGEKKMPISFPWGSALKFGILAGLMFLLVNQLQTAVPLLTLIVRICVGGLFYGIMVLAFDTPTRAIVRGAVSGR